MNQNRRKFLQDTSVMMALLFAGTPACTTLKSSLPSKSLPHSCALKGKINDYGLKLFKTSGNRDLDRSLNLELGHLADSFDILPGFGFFDDSKGGNAFATTETWVANTRGTVVFGKKLLSRELSRHSWGGLAVAGIMAHEFAHIYQYQSRYHQQLTQGQTTNKLLELHADYLAGYYLGLKRLRTNGTFDIKSFADSLYMMGDSNFNSRTHHGTPIERMKVMIEGYKKGLANNSTIHQVAESGMNFVKK